MKPFAVVEPRGPRAAARLAREVNRACAGWLNTWTRGAPMRMWLA
jgi:hypothetical protein